MKYKQHRSHKRRTAFCSAMNSNANASMDAGGGVFSHLVVTASWVAAIQSYATKTLAAGDAGLTYCRAAIHIRIQASTVYCHLLELNTQSHANAKCWRIFFF